MRTARTVTIRRWVEDTGTRDRYNNPVAGWAEEDVRVYAVAPRQSVEPDEDGRRAVISGLTVHAPLEVTVTAHDRVVVDGTVYDVEGEPGRYAKAPTHPGVLVRGGVVINLTRSTG